MNRISIALHEGATPTSRPELSVLQTKPGFSLTPIRHIAAVESVSAAIPDGSIVDEFHAISHGGSRYTGLFEVNENWEIRRLIGVTNANDGTGTLDLHSGISVPAFDRIILFQNSHTIFKKYTYVPEEQIRLLVNEKVHEMREEFNCMLERMDHFKQIKLADRDAHHLICETLYTEIVAGRVAHEFIHKWRKPDNAYLDGKNLWSLFLISSWFLNRLKAPQLIERTKQLCDLFDKFARFTPKQTTWVQTQFA